LWDAPGIENPGNCSPRRAKVNWPAPDSRTGNTNTGTFGHLSALN